MVGKGQPTSVVLFLQDISGAYQVLLHWFQAIDLERLGNLMELAQHNWPGSLHQYGSWSPFLPVPATFPLPHLVDGDCFLKLAGWKNNLKKNHYKFNHCRHVFAQKLMHIWIFFNLFF